MSVGRGFSSRCAASKAVIWGTAAGTPTDRIPLISEGLKENWPLEQRESITGKAGWRSVERQGKFAEGSLEAWLCYDRKAGATFVGTDLLIAAAMGNVTWDTFNLSNQITLAEDVSSFLTLAYIKRFDLSAPNNSTVWEVPTAMINSLEISGEAGKPGQISLDILGTDLVRTGTSITAAEINALSSNAPSRVQFGDLILRIGDLADALADADKTRIRKYSLKFENALSEDNFCTPGSTGIPVGNRIDQPVRSDIRSANLEITLDRYRDENFFAELASLSAFQADLVFASGANAFRIYLPHLIVDDPETLISGSELMEKKVLLRCLRGADYGSSGNTFMRMLDGVTTIAEEFAIEVKDERVAAIW